MKHFKNHNPGFSFIEIMAALTLLAILGTSLFSLQMNLLSKIFTTHSLIMINNDFELELQEFDIKVKKAISQKQSPDTIKTQITKENPHRIITIQLKAIPQNSQLYKSFAQHAKMVNITIQQNGKTYQWHSYMYLPPQQPESATSNQAQQAQNAKGAVNT